MNFAEEVAGAIGDLLNPRRLYEDENAITASHGVEVVWPQPTPTSLVADAYRFAADGDTRIPMGRVRVEVAYEPNESTTSTGDPS